MKGISPLIASVLLIGFTVGVAVILSGWITHFTKTSTDIVEEEGKESILCSYGGITLRNVKFGTTTKNISGVIENTGTIDLGNIDIQILYTNGTDLLHDLNYTLTPGKQISFNISFGASSTSECNEDICVRVSTNCSKVYDELKRSEITT